MGAELGRVKWLKIGYGNVLFFMWLFLSYIVFGEFAVVVVVVVVVKLKNFFI